MESVPGVTLGRVSLVKNSSALVACVDPCPRDCGLERAKEDCDRFGKSPSQLKPTAPEPAEAWLAVDCVKPLDCQRTPVVLTSLIVVRNSGRPNERGSYAWGALEVYVTY